MVERADPGTVAEAVRLRDRATGLAEEVKRAQRAAAESREAVGRESAINQVLFTPPPFFSSYTAKATQTIFPGVCLQNGLKTFLNSNP